MSTFAVEMSELRVILKMADKNSLILGDELCSGTEHDSAVSIFVSGLEMLHEKNTSAVFATHLHEIVHFEEIENMKKIDINLMFAIVIIFLGVCGITYGIIKYSESKDKPLEVQEV